MNVKKKARRVMSGLLTAVTVLSTVLSPAVAYASDDAGSVKKIPYYEEIKDQLDEDEVVTAKDYEIKVGDNFDVKSDYTGLTIQDDSKVNVTFQEAKDTDGNDFSTDYANSYKAVYYVEPQTTDHPTYQINRKIVVKEADQQKDSQSESSSDQDAGSSDETETEDSEAGSSTEETGDAKTESKTELTEKEFDAEIEATENQETVDPETGITLSEVMQEAVDQEVALADLEAGESITFDMPMMLASGETGTKSVTVTAGSWYYYADYGLGSYLTCPYYVKWGSINATAYCVEPSKKGPGNGTYTIQKLADGKTLAKVCYYGTKASDENGFFDEKHPDFPAGKRFIITHLAAAYANGSSDWASGTNATGKNLAMELYNYCVNMPDIPSVDMSFSESNVKAYVEGNSQRTSVITFKADKLQTITFKLPSGVKLVNVTTGKTSAAGASVEISGGTQFYLTAPLDQAESVSATFSSRMKGSIDKEYSAYKIVTGSGTQDLALVFGEGVGNEKYVDFKVTWTKECKVSIVKKDQDTGNALAGAVYGIYSDAACTKLIAEMPATDQNGASQLTMEKTQEVVYLKEISVPTGYQIDTKSYNVTLAIGKTTTKNVTDKRVNAKLNIAKQDAETGNEAQGDATLEGAVYGLYAREDIVHPDGRTGTIYKKDTLITSLTTDKNGEASVSDLYLGKYYLKELSAPVGYVLDPTEHDVDCTYEGATVPTVERTSVCKETVVKQPFQIIKAANNGKTDADLLKGVGFSAWLVSDLKVKADGQRTLYFSKDALVATVTTDADGYATVKNLPLGRYYVKEKNAPDTYVLNTVPENVEFAYADQDTAVIEKEISVTDERQKVSITVEKQDAETGNTVAGAVFGIYNAKDIQTKDGKVIVKADTLLQEMTSDEKGQAACTLDLPLGSYYVKELKAPDGFVSSDEVLRFDASYQGQDVQTVTLKSVKKNQPTTVEITKSDATTGVELDGAYLKVTDKDGNVVDSWTSSKDAPHVIKYLKVGETYTLHEEFAPHGYLVANDVTFTVKDTGEVQKVEMKDEVPVGELIINKKGEFLDSVTLADKVKGVVEHIFNYVTGKLTDVTFEVYAEEDIKAADGVSDDYYKKDELIATIKTDETGIAKLENLPLGKYYVKETGTAYGHVLDGEIRHVDLTYVDQNTPVVVYDKDWQNNRQRVEVSVLKKEKDSDRTLEGAIFGLFAKEDIKSETTGKVLIEADEIIELKSTDEEGKITFVADLPIGATYYVKELYAPDGFVTNDEVKEFTFEYAGENQPTVTYDFTFENQPTVVEFTKSSLTTGKELPGCKLKVVDADGNIVDEWTSGKEAHVIRELTVGKEYTLVETKPADGYVTAESVKFTIKDTADVQKVEMKDDVTKVKISKQDIAGKELPGAKLTILDQDGKVVESWTSTEKAHYIEMLPIGKYTLREETAPDGYLVAKDVEFEVKDTSEVQHVTMVDEEKPAEKTPEGGKPVSDSPKTGDNTNLWLWFMLLGIGATGTGALAFMRKKKH